MTGIGLVTPLATGRLPTWKRLIAGESGIGSVRSFDASGLAARVAAEVKIACDEGEDKEGLNIGSLLELPSQEARKVGQLETSKLDTVGRYTWLTYLAFFLSSTEGLFIFH